MVTGVKKPAPSRETGALFSAFLEEIDPVTYRGFRSDDFVEDHERHLWGNNYEVKSFRDIQAVLFALWDLVSNLDELDFIRIRYF